ncbi:hypothetical protein OAL58_06415 [Verrucomicrobia bacterium]|nr:hypothetical protein [Verrucomicrobiota bacterium]
MATHTHTQQNLTDLTERLHQHAQQVTGPRQLILEVLRREDHPLSARQIHG